jgi:hypothetical protein
LLLDRAAVLPDGWQALWRIWPLVFVAWGAGVLMGKGRWRWVVGACAGAILGIVLVAMFAAAVAMPWLRDDADWDGEPVVQQFTVPWEGVGKARLTMDGGAGKFVLGGAATNLFEAETRSNLQEFKLSHERVDGEEHVRLSMSGRHRGWRFGAMRNRAEVRLHPAPSWELEVDVGAAGAELNLEELNVRRVDLNTGASRIRLRLGGRAESTDVRINAGASAISIVVPDTLGCELDVEAPLSSKHFDGFQKEGSGLYRTEGFADATRVVRISVDAGVSSLRVERE